MSPRFTLAALFTIFAMLVLTGGVTAEGRAAPAAAITPTGQGFTYQGSLRNANGPVTDTCDFKFRLYDALEDGSQVGGEQSESVSVVGGLFTVTLNDSGQFGAQPFDGAARWLEIDVQCPPDEAYTTLAPRQPVSAAPYAVFAETIFRRTVVVKPVGTAAENGAALLAALASITDNSADNPYLVRIEPGVYDVGGTAVPMKEYVDIEGSGELTTKITGTGSSTANTGTVLGANNAELRYLTVESIGGTSHTYAIFISAASPRLTHVTAVASGGGGFNAGVRNQSGAAPVMTHVTAFASDGTTAMGVYNLSSSSATMTNVTASASGGTGNIGVYNVSSSPTMTGVIASGSGGSTSYGVFTSMSPVTIRNSVVAASGGSSLNIGIVSVAPIGGYVVTVDSSQIFGTTSTIHSNLDITFRVGSSLLDGGAVQANGGAFACVGVYDEDYIALSDTCT